MIPVDECKKILLDCGESFSDEEILRIREFLYQMAKVVVEDKKVENEE